MAFTLIEEQVAPSSPKKKTFEEKGAELAEGVGQAAASGLTSVGSAIAGAPGDVLSFVNEFAARPLTEFFTGEQSKPYEEMGISGFLPTSANIKSQVHKTIPFTQPRNDFQRSANNTVETMTQLLIPGAQAKVGRFFKTDPVTRALFKSIGAEGVKSGIEDITGEEGSGDLAKAGALFTMALMDRPGAKKYVGAIYKNAEKALEQAGNPQVAAGALKNEVTGLRNKLTTGTLAPSEQAVVSDIDEALKHFNGNNIKVENLWGITRSLNEKKQDVLRSAASKQGRERARSLYDGLIRNFNRELSTYGKSNPEFGKPFKDAQEAYATMAKSEFLTNWAKNNLSYIPDNKWLPYIFGGTVGAGIGKATSGISGTSAAAPVAAYQAGKFLYKIQRSPTLRKYYLEALSAAAREDAPLFNKAVEKMDKIIDREDSSKPSYSLLEE